MNRGVSIALGIEAREYMRNSETIKSMVNSGELSQAGAELRRAVILLKLWQAIEREGVRSRGRPKIEKFDAAKPIGMLYQTEPPKMNKGRPTADLSWWFELVYQTVEGERGRLITQRKNNGSVRAAIRSVLALRLAPAMGWNRATADEKFESLRADYRRGKALMRGRSKSDREA